MLKEKKILFSVTAKDCRVEAFRGSGDGGQKRQKTSSGIRITHEPSGAVGKATDTRKQSENKQLAFRRMAETKEFQTWLRVESAKKLGTAKQIEHEIEESLKRVKVESKNDEGRWVDGLTEDTNNGR